MKYNVAIFISLACALNVEAQDASTRYVLITSNNTQPQNSFNSYEFDEAGLTELPRLQTGGSGTDYGFTSHQQQVLTRAGSNACLFVADSGSSDIASFNATGLQTPIKVGNYIDPTGIASGPGMALAVYGTLLFASYSKSTNLAVWGVHSDCSLTLLNAAGNTPTSRAAALAVTPDGKTLVETYAGTTPGVGSFAIDGSVLVSRGTFNATDETNGLDITKDSKFALVGEYEEFGNTVVSVYPINADGSLGAEDYYSFAQGGVGAGNVWLSPDESVLYVSNVYSGQVTTLSFHEYAGPGQRLTFACLSDPLIDVTNRSLTGGVATQRPVSKGGYLYVAEFSNANPAAIGVMQIPENGCPAEIADSPIVDPAGRNVYNFIAYPPRPF